MSAARRRTFVFWAVVAAQALFLLSWAGYHEYVRQTAPRILLRPRPVDPRDLVRGDYITLDYDIRHLTCPKAEKIDAWGEAFVVLEKRGELHEAVRISRNVPAVKPGQTWVRATVDQLDQMDKKEACIVSYGIEQYFVPEGMGTPSFEQLRVEAAVSPAHKLYIRSLLVNGKPYP